MIQIQHLSYIIQNIFNPVQSLYPKEALPGNIGEQLMDFVAKTI